MAWTIDLIQMGRFGLDGGAMFGIIPKPLWQRTNASDENNRIELATNCMLLRQGKRSVIVETGNSFEFSAKEKEIYAINRQLSWESALAPFSLKPNDITDVICTHLHFDHAGGLSHLNSNGKRQITFTNATHHVQKRHLEWAKKPTEKDGGSFRSEGVTPFIESDAKIELADGDGELFDGIRVRTVHGHTPHQQLVEIPQNNQSWVFVADLFPTTSHLHLPYIMSYDVEPLKTLNEKKSFLADALEQQWVLWYYHDPKVLAAKVAFDGKRYKMGDVVRTLETKS